MCSFVKMNTEVNTEDDYGQYCNDLKKMKRIKIRHCIIPKQ